MQQGWGVFWRETIFMWKDAPLLPVLNGLALFIPGLSPIFACRGTVVVMAAIGALFLWGITRNWWVLIFYLLNPFNFFIDRTSLMESVFVTMVLFYLWTVLRGKKFLSIAAVGLLFAAKQSALIALPFPWLLEGKLKKYKDEICLLNQPWIKDDSKTIKNLVEEAVAKIGENIEVKKFSRFEI